MLFICKPVSSCEARLWEYVFFFASSDDLIRTWLVMKNKNK
jgi:hypothetical protein